MREYSLGVPQDLAAHLDEDHLAVLRGIGIYRRMARGQHLYRQGESAEHIYLLHAGSAKSYIINALGHEAMLRIHLPGSLLGLTAIASDPWRDAGAMALEPVEVFAIRHDHLQETIRGHGDLGLRLVTLLVDRMRDFHYRVGEMQAQTVEQRIARTLLAVCRTTRDGGREMEAGVDLSHQDIANLVNSRRQTVTGILGQLEEAGLIARSGRRLRIIDRAGLEARLPHLETSVGAARILSGTSSS